MAPETLDVHIGSWPPARWNEIDTIRAGANPNAWGHTPRPAIVSEDIDWTQFGFVPRWLADDSSEAVAAIEPSPFAGQGAEEWRRFVAGAGVRGELALVVSMVGGADEPIRRSIFGPSASVMLPGADGSSVGGQRLALASPPDLAPNLGRADRDLALRLVDAGVRPRELPWWNLELSEVHEHRFGLELATTTEGTLLPLLISRMGEVVAAVWTAPDDTIRHYVLPFLPDYAPVLRWLSDRAIPEFVPTAARRRRSSLAGEPEFQTATEASLLAELVDLEADYQRRHADLSARATQAKDEVDRVRVPLLYGSDAPVVAALRRILEDSDLLVDNVDELLDGTLNADLLATWRDRRVLVEVKGVTGNPSEGQTESPRRHLATWPKLRPDLPVEGVVFVINHQSKTHPLDRSPQPYSRPEFVASLTFPIVPALELFDLWRRGDYAAIRSAIFGR